jgi:hypothetical protein
LPKFSLLQLLTHPNTNFAFRQVIPSLFFHHLSTRTPLNMVPLTYQGPHFCEHCRDICLNASASTTQSKTALASLLNTIPAKAASKINLGSLGRFGFIALTEEKIRKALAARCKLFTLLEADIRYRRHLATSTTSQRFLLVERFSFITVDTVSFSYINSSTLADVMDILRSAPVRTTFYMLASQGSCSRRPGL